MADLFGRTDQVLNGGLSSDSMFMSWPELDTTEGGLGLLIQRVRLEYRQPIRRIFEIGPGVIPMPYEGGGTVNISAAFCDDTEEADASCSNRTQPTYYIIGRPEGRLSLNRFVGPNVIVNTFYATYGSACGQNLITLSGRAGCSGSTLGPKMQWIANGVVLDNVGMTVTGQEMVIEEEVGAMFVGLNLTITP